MSELRTISIRGIAFEVLSRDGQVWLPVKRLCGRLDLPWEAQRKRIRRQALLAPHAELISFVTEGGPQSMLCLPTEVVPLFLLGLVPSRFPELHRAAISALRLVTAEELRLAVAAVG